MPYCDYVTTNSLDDSPLVLVKAGRVALMAVRAINTTAADAYVQIFDAAAIADVSLGTTIPTWVVQSDANDPSVGDGLPTDGLIFNLGIVIASTTTALGSTAAIQHVRVCIQ